MKLEEVRAAGLAFPALEPPSDGPLILQGSRKEKKGQAVQKTTQHKTPPTYNDVDCPSQSRFRVLPPADGIDGRLSAMLRRDFFRSVACVAFFLQSC